MGGESGGLLGGGDLGASLRAIQNTCTWIAIQQHRYRNGERRKLKGKPAREKKRKKWGRNSRERKQHAPRLGEVSDGAVGSGQYNYFGMIGAGEKR